MVETVSINILPSPYLSSKILWKKHGPCGFHLCQRATITNPQPCQEQLIWGVSIYRGVPQKWDCFRRENPKTSIIMGYISGNHQISTTCFDETQDIRRSTAIFGIFFTKPAPESPQWRRGNGPLDHQALGVTAWPTRLRRWWCGGLIAIRKCMYTCMHAVSYSIVYCIHNRKYAVIIRSLNVFDFHRKIIAAENRFAAKALCVQLLKALQHETSDNVVGNPNLLHAGPAV